MLNCLVIAYKNCLEVFPVGDAAQNRVFVDRVVEIKGSLSPTDRALLGRIIEKNDFSMFEGGANSLQSATIAGLSMYRGRIGAPKK